MHAWADAATFSVEPVMVAVVFILTACMRWQDKALREEQVNVMVHTLDQQNADVVLLKKELNTRSHLCIVQIEKLEKVCLCDVEVSI